MLAGNWFGKNRLFSRAKSAHRPLKKAPRRKNAPESRGLRVEELEDRRMLATFVVNNLGDLVPDGSATQVGTLRQAIELANADDVLDTIVFADFLFTDPFSRQTTSQTIFLDPRENGRQIQITQPLRILGPGAATLTIQGSGNNQRIFETNIGSDDEFFEVTIGGVTLTGGNLTGTAEDDANRGGAIFNREILTLVETEVVGNNATWGGGAVYSPIGSVNVNRSLFENNVSGGGGGGVLLGTGDEDVRPRLTVEDSTFTGNFTFPVGIEEPQPGYGGGIYNRGGIAEITSSTFIGNNATNGGGGVATNGVPLGDDATDIVAPIVTELSHNVLFNNTGVRNPVDPTSFADDVFAVRTMIVDNELTHLAPTLLIDGPGRGYNFIGAIGDTVWREGVEDGKGTFYQVVNLNVGEDPSGISWFAADTYAEYGQTPRNPEGDPLEPNPGSHLATPSTDEENTFIFDNLVSDARFWRLFQPEDVGEPPMTPPPQFIGPWIGGLQTDMENEPDMGWEWVTAPEEEFVFTDWAAGQPDDGVGADPEMPGPAEGFISYFAEGTATADTWGDLPNEPEDEQAPVAYVLEYDPGTNFYNLDPQLLALDYYGGPTRVFYPNSFSDSPLIDTGDPTILPSFFEHDQRGVHFTRVFGAAVDIGAVEVQNGLFIVDTLFDETDGQYTAAYAQDGVFFTDPTYTTRGDFALREAIEFSELNPEFDTITFSNSLLSLDDPTSSAAPTILLKLTSGVDFRSALGVTRSVDIFGPTGFELELDATGNDATPTVNNADGTRIFAINDFDPSFISSVSISGLTLLGGDVVGDGGAILNREDLLLDNVSIKENAASTGGGGITSSDGELIITGSSLVANRGGFEGGAIKLASPTDPGNLSRATVRNSTVSGNFAARGSGIVNENGELLVEFSTITDNTGSIGAGIANVNNPDTFTQVSSSIVSANNGTDIQILQSAVPNVQSLGFNLIGSGNALSVFNQPGDLPGVVNPMISPLVFEGGFTPVHRLLPGSPAIDAGESTAIAGDGNVPLNDQRGAPFTRVFDGVQDTKDRIDIGAYELQGTTFVVDSPFDEDDGIISLGNLSLREAVELSNANPLPDVIMFDAVALAGATIFQSAKNSFNLQPGTPTDIRITDSVTIVGLGESLLTLDGTAAFTDLNVIPPFGEPPMRSRFFTIDDGDNANNLQVTISDLTFAGSTNITQVGASVMSREDLMLSDVTFTGNSTLGDGFNGGALYQQMGSLTLDDVTLTANSTNGVDADGGAVYVRDADATIVDSVISGNSTAQTLGSGGGFYIRGGTLNMTNSTVASNLTPGGEADGAGIFGNQSVLNISYSYITGNSMTGSNSEGAGIHSKDSTLTLTDSFVSLNSTTGTQSEGAGIYINGGSASISRSTVSLNTTSGLIAAGGGIAVASGDVIVQSTSVDRNSTSGSNAPGGGIHNLNGNVTVVDSTISGNSVSGLGSKGGGVFSDTLLGGSEKTLLINSTVSGNSTSTSGGGVYNNSGLTEIRHSTVTSNSTPFFGTGGGVASRSAGAGISTRVYSTIIAGNLTSNDGGNPLSDVDSPGGAGLNTFHSLGYNVIGLGLPLALGEFNSTGDQISIADPKLGLLTFNGGLTFTHAPEESSPAVNAGDPSAIPGLGSVPSFDQRGTGFGRRLGGRIDVGAVESPFMPTAEADFDGDGDVDGSDFLAWQRGFGTLAPIKSDGDANLDGSVNGTDLSMWQASYGDAPLSFAASTGGGSVGQTAAASAQISEPTSTTIVLTTDSLPSGLILPVASNDNESSVVVETTVLVQNVPGTRDRAFADLSTRSDYRTPGGEESSEQEEEETTVDELQLSAEDRLFEVLGA